jgi:PAS domain S-box-containing protein
MAKNSDFLLDGGESGTLLRSRDWTHSALGPVENWPQSLRTAVSLCLNASFPALLCWGTELVMIYNDAFRPILGGKHPTAMGCPAKKVWQETWHLRGPVLQSVLGGGKPACLDEALLPVDRREAAEGASLAFACSPVHGEEGIGGVFCAVTETARRVVDDHRLKAPGSLEHPSPQSPPEPNTAPAGNRTQKDLYHLLQQAPVALLILRGPDLRVELANQHYLEMVGKNREDFVGRPLLESMPGIISQSIGNLLNRVVATGEPYFGHEVPVALSRSGKEGYFNFVFQPLCDPDDAISGVMVLAHEITELVESRRKIAESEHRFRTVADSAPVMIWMAGPGREFNFVNKGWLQFTGRKGEQEAGNGWQEGVHPDDLPGLQQLFTDAYNARKGFTREFRLRRHDGQYRYVSVVAVPRYGSDGSFAGFIGSCLDKQDQKEAAEALEWEVEKRTRDLTIANSQLERSNRELEQFAYAASHDMQEPLRKIQTFASFLEENAPEALAETPRRFITKIRESAKRMAGIIDDLLHYSRQGRNDLGFVETDLNGVIAGVRSDLELLIQQKGGSISADHLPMIQAVPLQMHQLFYNLINNALKFSRPGVPPEIRIKAKVIHKDEEKNSPPYFVITVQDNGIGFEQQYADKIFQLFQRLNDRYSYSGTGIGLALCKKIVVNHGGEITARSEPDKGATFTILLPAYQKEM